MSGVTPPEEARRLQGFAGEWAVTGSMSDGADRHPISGRWRFTEAVGGWGVKGSLLTTIEGLGTFEEEELIGVDAEGGLIHMFSMNEFTIRDHVGRWERSDTLVTRFESREGGDRTVETMTIRLLDADHMEANVVERRGDQIIMETELSFEKVGSDEGSG